jgi:homoserine O-succinyltransferase/O-acetyltransferase
VGARLARAAATGPGASTQGVDGPVRWRCALVNNMPDSAFEATERQYIDLLDAGSGCETVEVSRHTMVGVPRGERAAARIAEAYAPVEEIADDPPDLLIVTGSNPLEPRIEDEPYWDDLAGLLSWGCDHVPSMFLSCLSAHAALSVFDGIERTRLSDKCTGVFPQRPDPTHPLAADLVSPVVLPHSRLNAVADEVVCGAGYRVALRSEVVGWSVVTKRMGRSELILVQGHPEYDPTSLLREYHRDVRRYVLHERDELPCLPVDCVDPADWESLRRLHERVTGGERNHELVESFPFDEIGGRAPWPWRGAATRLYGNLLNGIPKRSV